jgi:hypothetical protein
MPRRTRAAAVTALRRAYASVVLPEGAQLHEHVRGQVGLQRTAIDFAISNGQLSQLSHGWSFSVRDPASTSQQIKAWCWTMRDLRDHGGKIYFGKQTSGVDVPQDVRVEVAYVEPVNDEGRRSRDEALEVFGNLNVNAVPASAATLIASHVARNDTTSNA